MLLCSGLCKEYVKGLNKVGVLVGKIVDWNPSENRFRLHSPPFKKILFISLSFFICQNTYAFSMRDKDKSSTMSFWIVFAAFFAFIAIYCWETLQKLDQTEALICGLMSFEEHYCKNGEGITIQEKKKLSTAKLVCSTLTSVAVGPVGFGLGLIAVLLPKSILNVLSYPPGSWILSLLDIGLSQSGLYQIFVWTLVNGLNFLGNCYLFTVWYGTGANLANQVVTSTLSISVGIAVFRRRVEALTDLARVGKPIRHDEQNNEYCKSVQMYRELQILGCYFNQVHSIVLVSMIVVAMAGQVVSVVCLLSESSKEDAATDFFLRAFYAEGLILDILCINFIFGYCADVYVQSGNCINKLSHSCAIRRSKLLKRVVSSMPKIKITFGRTNFMDRLTPVVFQDYTNDKIVETLLLRQ